MVIKIVLLCSVAACVLAAPSPNGVIPLEKQQPTVIPILTQSEELEANGTYKFSYETANGIKREEVSYNKIIPKVEGRSKSGSSESGESGSDESNEIHVQEGSYSYTAPDGTLITVRYIADENGFRVFGDHLPKAPALTQQIQARANAKSSRTLKSDNAESESAPAVVAAEKPAEATNQPEEASVKLESRSGSDASAAEASTAAAASQEPATEVSAVKEAASDSAAVPTTATVNDKSEDASTLASEPSTTESASTTAAVASSEASTPSSEATTTGDASTTAAEVTSSEASSTPASEVTTTETASTTAAAASTTAESAITEAATTSAAEQSTTEAASSSAEGKSTAASEAASTEAQSSPESTTTEAASSTTSA